jgi:hypothetical protein
MKKYHYVYRINFVEIPGVYFGSRSCDCLPEEDTGYLGSPVTYKIYWDLYTPIKTILISDFEDRKPANIYEKDLIRQQWKRNQSLSLNIAAGNENYNRLGVKESEEIRRKKSERQKGKPSNIKGKTLSSETRKKLSIARLGKSYPNAGRKIVAISPDGDHVFSNNIAEFIRNNAEWGFQSAYITTCAKNPHKRSHRGWRFLYYEDYILLNGIIPPAQEPARHTKRFVAIAPSSEVIDFANATEFIKHYSEWRFDRSSITACANGRYPNYKGWKFFHYNEYKHLLDGSESNFIDIKAKPIIYRGRDYIGISPEGELIRFRNINRFCKENSHLKIRPCYVSSCLTGGIQDIKGWRFFYYDIYLSFNGELPKIDNKMVKIYKGISPDGEEYIFTSAAEFCRENPSLGLTQPGISNSLSGYRPRYKGWTFSCYIGSIEEVAA